MSLSCSLEGRSCQSLVSQLSKRIFYKDEQVTDEVLHTLYTGAEIDSNVMHTEISGIEEVWFWLLCDHCSISYFG